MTNKVDHKIIQGRSKQRGQALIEGTVALVLITAIVVGGTLLVIGAGLAVYYKSKLALAAEVGAKFGSQGKYWLGALRPNYTNADMTTDVTNAVNAALIGQGLPAAKSGNITATDSVINGIRGLKVTVQEDGLEIISGGLLPSTIAMSETSFYPYGNDKPIGVLGLSVEGMGEGTEGKGMFIPVYGGGANTAIGHTGVPTGTVDYWKIGIQKTTNSANGVISTFGNNGQPEQIKFDAPQDEH